MTNCLFVTDLHGRSSRFMSLFKSVKEFLPDVVLIGGDIFPNAYISKVESAVHGNDFLEDFFAANLRELKSELGDKYPVILLILGNDDAGNEEDEIIKIGNEGLFEYIHNKTINQSGYTFSGYSFVPPTPFLLKDWEKYDVSRYIDPGCVSPEEGIHTVKTEWNVIRYATISEDLEKLKCGIDMTKSVFLFHSPPYGTNLDLAAIEGKMIDHVPLDPHVGSVAVKRFIEVNQPKVTLHGHVHESTRLTGIWKENIGNTICINGASDSEELSLIRFSLEEPGNAERILI